MAEPIKCVVIDDEPKAVSVITSLITDIPDLELLASFTDPRIALTQIEELNPEMLFLDIEMPHKNGFEVLDSIRLMNLKPHVVFTTGYDEFAVKAIKKQAFDYLLKPITQSDILELLVRSKHQTRLNIDSSIPSQSRLKFNTLNGFYVVEIENIVYIQADGNYSELFMGDGNSRLITSNLAKIEILLDKKIFCRIGRSIIVNVDYLTQVDRRNGLCILNTNNEEVKLPINRKKIKELANMFY